MSTGRVENPVSVALPTAEQSDGREDLVWLRAVSDRSPVGIYRADARGHCTYVNARWCELTGMRADEAMGMGWLRAIHPQDRARIGREWESANLNDRAFESEYRYLRPDGTTVWILGQVTLLRDEEGRQIGCLGSVTDITELRAQKDELEVMRTTLEATVVERTQKLFHMAMAVEASNDAIVTSDSSKTIVSWNKAAETMFGWTAAEMIGSTTERLVPADLLDDALAIKTRARRGERVIGCETIRKTKSGAHIDVSVSVFPLRDSRSKIIGTCAIVRDLTDLRKAERRLQRLSWRLLQAQDEERRRLARELHDSAAQTVVALSMNLARLARPGDYLAPEKRDAILATCLDLAASATRELRTTVYLLHPPLLEERGLADALIWFVGGFQARSGIEVALDIDPDLERLPGRLELALFRVAQEGLSNVHRHSGSRTVALSLRRGAGAVVLEIQDAGCGLSSGVNLEEGVGISGMRERMAELGGTFDVVFTAGGAKLTASVSV